MEKIDSFTVDHNKLKRGIYVSRKDKVGAEVVTTFDIRTKLANQEPAMDIPAMHTMEHLGATFLRNHKEWSEKTIYFGPMGCRTGFYIIFHGDLKSEDIVEVTREMFDFMAEFEGEIPGTNKIECGNYVSHDLTVAKWESNKYRSEVLSDLKEENLNYPQ
ncbi:S-ribosylhomocysteine lyase [Marinifilum caeruleilacunae]|uniref:S-ribosylhomocysteine lyase n=1 Tax=Marinifilum caeruleilacunae TaxID=2499076 RepID=A0ABX1WVU2_9BACT|nr:S-ribosylhomocysteine lyase [Marinifilum caeruleilacunae]NOU60126.1 S-ribosylhomocysteine lyase [Marinifilum caeruleilacunae]